MRAAGPSNAIIQHLKSCGIKIRPPKKLPSPDVQRKTPSEGLFGVPLRSLPLCNKEGDIPQFLVDSCQFLSQHLSTEGLFRKSGSVTRIKTLKAQLESGESCLNSALPCDVASLLKQFFRELPQPLILPELQDPLCQIQESVGEGDRGSAIILVTCLLPSINRGTLQYFCTFLQSVASRCDENRMDSGNLALVLAPNLFPSSGLGEKRTLGTERQLQLQTSVMQILIEQAQHIGQFPLFIVEKVPLPPDPVEDESVNPKRGGNRRRCRRSMGGLVNEALNKLKSGRAASNALLDRVADELVQPQRSKSKRKASEDTVHGEQCTAKKRRSLRDPADLNESNEDSCDLTSSLTPCRDTPVSEDVFCDLPLSPSLLLELSTESLSLPATPECFSRGKKPRNKRKESKRVQRVHSGRVGCISPVLLERKDKVRSSLRLFHRTRALKQSTPEGKTVEESGWNLMKRMVAEALEGPIFNGRDFRVAPLTLKTTDHANPLSVESSPGRPSSSSSLHSSPSWKTTRDTGEEKGESGGKKRCTLRRSLSMPEIVGECMKAEGEWQTLYPTEQIAPSLREEVVLQGNGTVKSAEENSQVDGAASEGCLVGTPESDTNCTNPEETLSSLQRKLSVSELPQSVQPFRRPSNGHAMQYRSVRKLVLSFPWGSHPPSPDSQRENSGELANHPLRRRGARRFSRSLSESGLGAAEDTGCEGLGRREEGENESCKASKSPPKTLSVRSRQIFVSHKNITLSSWGQQSLETGLLTSLDTDPPVEGQPPRELMNPSWDLSFVH
ncbi:hypothetical protein FKM82_015888 [Ascaphus truei]